MTTGALVGDVWARLRAALQERAREVGVGLPPLDEQRDVSVVQVARQAGLEETHIAAAVASALEIPVLGDMGGCLPSAQFVERIPIAFARQHRLLGLASDNGCLRVAIADPAALEQLDVLARYLGRAVQAVLAPPAQIASAINAAYQQRSGEAQAVIQRLDRREVLDELVQSTGRAEDLLDSSGRAPIIKLVNLMVFEAAQASASDVHLQPYEDKLIVRLRIDGILFDAFDLPKAVQEEVISRVKVMGRMDIAEKRLAQDGRATVQVGDRIIDLRIASLPTSYGERIVIRLLDKGARLYTLGELGMPPSILGQFRRLIALEHGLILVTGPTGSGKTTTLYAALQELNAKERNILTLEDPIEYQLQGISQTQVSEKKGMTFAGGLRHVLRQDPDVIMVGEIRDRETAVMAIQSALTGHLVFSTLHTNDAASAITRLLDLGIEPYLVASSLVGAMAQRLVRRVCRSCAAADQPGGSDLRLLGLDPAAVAPGQMRRGRGCKSCRETGYSGRVGIFELLTVDEPVRRRIQSCATASEIKATAAEAGMKALLDDGVSKILNGTTTPDEVLRVGCAIA